MEQRYIDCANCASKDHKELVKVRGNRGVDFIAQEHHVVVCQNCGLVFINPQHDDRDYDRFYKIFNYKKEKKAISREEILARYTFKKIPLKFLVDFMQSGHFLETRPRILDIGCGFGMVIYFMNDFGLKAEGLEQSVDAVEYAQKKLGLKVHPGSIFSHDLLSGHYDVVFSTAVMEHLTNPLAALGQMRKLLKPDGLLFVNTPDFKGMVLREGIGRYFKFVHTFYYTNVTLSSLIQLAGFEIVKTWQMPPILRYSTFFHPANAYFGELNIIARKKDFDSTPSPLKDDVEEIFQVFKAARKRDRLYSRLHVLRHKKRLGYPYRFIRKNFTKPRDVFRDYFNGNEVVADYQSVRSLSG
jgi:2-polyprenyl-3-methyl-5-hydroxy-6-metoxy-1,4-benzoquinol methylase